MAKGQINKRLFFAFSFLLFTAYSLLLAQATPAEAAVEPVGSFTHVEGKVDILRGEAPAITVKAGDPVYVKDIVRTKSASKAELQFTDGNILKLAQRTRIDISEYAADGARTKEVIRLPRGKVEAVVEKKLANRISVTPEANKFEIHTPNAVAGVRGTWYFVSHNENFTGVLVKDGIVYIFNPEFPKAFVAAGAGYFTSVSGKGAPEKPRPATDIEKKGYERDASPSEGRHGEQGVLSTEQPSLATPSPTETIKMTTALTQTLPSVEVGRVTLSGALVAGSQTAMNYLAVTMNNVVFFAPSTGAPPSIWSTNNVTGTYTFGSSLNSTNITNNAFSVGNGHGLSAMFQFQNWNTGSNTWSAAITNGSGTLSGGSYTGNITFSGTGSGTIAPGAISGTASGTAK